MIYRNLAAIVVVFVGLNGDAPAQQREDAQQQEGAQPAKQLRDDDEQRGDAARSRAAGRRVPPSGSRRETGPAGDWRGLPQPGSMLPQVKVFDEKGNAFSTASLRGRYTVLVFGCLT